MDLIQGRSIVKLKSHQEDTVYILSPPGALTYLSENEDSSAFGNTSGSTDE